MRNWIQRGLVKNKISKYSYKFLYFMGITTIFLNCVVPWTVIISVLHIKLTQITIWPQMIQLRMVSTLIITCDLFSLIFDWKVWCDWVTMSHIEGISNTHFLCNLMHISILTIFHSRCFYTNREYINQHRIIKCLSNCMYVKRWMKLFIHPLNSAVILVK